MRTYNPVTQRFAEAEEGVLDLTRRDVVYVIDRYAAGYDPASLWMQDSWGDRWSLTAEFDRYYELHRLDLHNTAARYLTFGHLFDDDLLTEQLVVEDGRECASVCGIASSTCVDVCFVFCSSGSPFNDDPVAVSFVGGSINCDQLPDRGASLGGRRPSKLEDESPELPFLDDPIPRPWDGDTDPIPERGDKPVLPSSDPDNPGGGGGHRPDQPGPGGDPISGGSSGGSNPGSVGGSTDPAPDVNPGEGGGTSSSTGSSAAPGSSSGSTGGSSSGSTGSSGGSSGYSGGSGGSSSGGSGGGGPRGGGGSGRL